MSYQSILISAERGVDYLLANIREDGSFVYQRDGSTGEIKGGYNILRHAGSLYILYQAMSWHQSPAAGPILEQCRLYLMKHVLPFPAAGDQASCVVEHDEVKLGGTGLALLALVECYRLQPEDQLLIEMRRLATFLLWMQKKSGKFRSKLIYSTGAFTSFESVYYSGEAILALLRLAAVDPDSRWREAATAGADYLLKNPVNSEVFDRGHNHWFAIALTELYMVVPQKKYYKEFWRIADSTYLETQHNLSEIRDPSGLLPAFSSAQMATRGETLVAGLELEIKLGKTERVESLMAVLEELLVYCFSLQVTEDPQGVGIKGGIQSGKTKTLIRVDFVQHVLAVFIGFRQAKYAAKELID